LFSLPRGDARRCASRLPLAFIFRAFGAPFPLFVQSLLNMEVEWSCGNQALPTTTPTRGHAGNFVGPHWVSKLQPGRNHSELIPLRLWHRKQSVVVLKVVGSHCEVLHRWRSILHYRPIEPVEVSIPLRQSTATAEYPRRSTHSKWRTTSTRAVGKTD
jgi:hypothetical protein